MTTTVAVADEPARKTLPRPAAAGEAAADAVRPVTLAGLMAQLLALTLVVYLFEIESESFFHLMVLTVAGFLVHYLLPLRHRLPFFVALSLAGIVLVLGIPQGAWLVALGLAIIGIAHLPVNVFLRGGVLVALGIALALPRRGLVEVPWSAAIWPILGSMFVFRMIIYLYDRHHGFAPARLSQTLAYFFLLPNVCFPLFPVVDFKKFCRGYYDRDRHEIYQVGVEWMWRGLVQLVLYRVVYYHLTVDPFAVENVGTLAVYMLSTFFLYVRVSGYFHLVAGMLHLFGFNLAETHHRYFLASSFTDFWRRINIYWKDFVMKVFYYPAYFRLRRFGDTRALVLATVYAFAATWALHVVQWFWIRGSVFVEWHDVLFWSILGLLVVVNSLYEAKRGRARILAKPARTLGESAGLVARTAGTFVVLCVLWSFWSSESAGDWLLLVGDALRPPALDLAQSAALAGAIGLGLGLSVYGVWKGWGSGRRDLSARYSPSTIVVTSLALCLVTTPALTARLGEGGAALETLRATSLSRRDAEQFQRGYYENLVEVGRFNNELWMLYENVPAGFERSLDAAGLARRTGDEQSYELIPATQGRLQGGWVQTNRWGMRDRDYALTPAPGTYRIAVLGPSDVMGAGVGDGEPFEAVLEDLLNAELAGTAGPGVEVLNFGVSGYSPLLSMYALERKALPFSPNAVLYVAHSNDMERTATQWGNHVRIGLVQQDPVLRDLAERSGITVGMSANEVRRRMKPYGRELLAWVYRRIAAVSREQGARPVFVFLQTVTEPAETWRAADREVVLEVAREAGLPIVDLTGLWAGREPSELWIAEGDGHPNAAGHRMIAERLRVLLREHGVPDHPPAARAEAQDGTR